MLNTDILEQESWRVMEDDLLTLLKYLFLIVSRVLLLDKIPVHGVSPVQAPTNPVGPQRVRSSDLDLVGYSCLKELRNAFRK